MESAANKIELLPKCKDTANCTHSDSRVLVLACAASFSPFRLGPSSLSEQESGASRRQRAVDPAVHAQGVTKRELPRERVRTENETACISDGACPRTLTHSTAHSQRSYLHKGMTGQRGGAAAQTETHMPRMRYGALAHWVGT